MYQSNYMKKEKFHSFLKEETKYTVYHQRIRQHADPVEGSRVTHWGCGDSNWSFSHVPGSWVRQWAAHRLHSRSRSHRGGAAVGQWTPQWTPGEKQTVCSNRLPLMSSNPALSSLPQSSVNKTQTGYLQQLWSWRHWLHPFPRWRTGCHSPWLLLSCICCWHSSRSGGQGEKCVKLN